MAVFILAFAVRLLLLPDYGLPFLTFYPAVVIVTLLCGIVPGLAVVLLSTIAGYHMLTDEFFSLAALSEQMPALSVFIVASSMVAIITDQMARNLIKVLRANYQLQQDIHHHVNSQAAMRESEHHFRSLFELFSVGVCLCDAITGQYVRVNKKFCEIVGYSAEELQTLTARDITQAQDFALQQEKIDAMLAGDISEYSIQKRYIKKDGSLVWVDLTCNALWSPLDTPTLHLAAVLDITDNCPVLANSNQANIDGDTMGDVCDDYRDGERAEPRGGQGEWSAMRPTPAVLQEREREARA